MPRILRPTGMRKYRPFGGPGGKLLSAAGGGRSYSDEITVDNPDIWYKMDEASGSIIDTQSYLNLGAAGTPVYAEAGLSSDGGTSILFDGSTDGFRGNLPDSALNDTALTVEAALNVDSVAANGTLIGVGDQSSASYAGWTITILNTTGNWYLEWYTGAWNNVNSGVAVTVDESAWWSHRVDWTNQNWYIYKNGSLVYTNESIGAGKPINSYYTDELSVGIRINSGAYRFFSGHMDQFVYFGSDIGATRIAAHAAGEGF